LLGKYGILRADAYREGGGEAQGNRGGTKRAEKWGDVYRGTFIPGCRPFIAERLFRAADRLSRDVYSGLQAVYRGQQKAPD